MIRNLSEFFEPEVDIFLDTVNYKRIESIETGGDCSQLMLCQDNLKAVVCEGNVRIVVTRRILFEPEGIFDLTVSFGADLSFNERKAEYDWSKINLTEEFRENGDFIIGQLMSRLSMLIGSITSSYGQPPLLLPALLAKKD